MFKAVIFDMDGVIVDSEPIHLKLERKMFRELGIDIDDSEHASYVGTTDRHMWEKIIERHNLDCTIEDLIKKSRYSFARYILSGNDVGAVDGVLDLMKDLYENNIKMIIASSAAGRNIEIIMDKLKINKYIKKYVCADDVENGKPEPDIFLYAADVIGEKKEDCIVIEDSKNGVLAAKSAGMKCIGYKNANSGDQDISKADIVVENLAVLNYDILKHL